MLLFHKWNSGANIDHLWLKNHIVTMWMVFCVLTCIILELWICTQYIYICIYIYIYIFFFRVAISWFILRFDIDENQKQGAIAILIQTSLKSAGKWCFPKILIALHDVSSCFIISWFISLVFDSMVFLCNFHCSHQVRCKELRPGGVVYSVVFIADGLSIQCAPAFIALLNAKITHDKQQKGDFRSLAGNLIDFVSISGHPKEKCQLKERLWDLWVKKRQWHPAIAMTFIQLVIQLRCNVWASLRDLSVKIFPSKNLNILDIFMG